MRVSHAVARRCVLLATLVGGSAMRVPTSVSRRAAIGYGMGATYLATGGAHPALAALAPEIREGEAALANANSVEEITASLEKLLGVVDEYQGLPSEALTKELVQAMRQKRSSAGQAWNGITEEAYNGLMRKIDPWRVTEIQPVFQYSLLAFVPVYVVLLAVQQIVPKAFNAAYAAGAALVLGPLLFQIIVG